MPSDASVKKDPPPKPLPVSLLSIVRSCNRFFFSFSSSLMAGKKKAPSSPDELDQPKTKVVKGTGDVSEAVDDAADATDEKPSIPSSDAGEIGRLIIVSKFFFLSFLSLTLSHHDQQFW